MSDTLSLYAESILNLAMLDEEAGEEEGEEEVDEEEGEEEGV